MSYDIELMERVMPRILEAIYSFNISGNKPTIEIIAKELNIPQPFIENVLDLAFKKGLVADDRISLTDAGREFILKYRQAFIHDRLMHGSESLENVGSSSITDHLMYSHGLSDVEIKSIRDFLSKFSGSIEDAEPLTNIPIGIKCIFIYAIGGYGMLRRLSDLGLTPGVELEVLSSGPLGGPIILKVRGYEIALGRGIASRVYVKRVR